MADKASLFRRIYPQVRRTLIHWNTFQARLKNQVPDLEDVVEKGDQWLENLDRTLGRFLFDFPIPAANTTQVYDLTFPSPLTCAAFKDHAPTLQIWAKMGLGGLCTKTILTEPRTGNPRPRLQEVEINTEKGLINAMGLPGKGIMDFLQDPGFQALCALSIPIGISIGGNTLEEYQSIAKTIETHLAKRPKTDVYFELNISCPNTPEGQQITRHPALLEALLNGIRTVASRPISIKLSPDQSDTDLCRAAEIAQSVEKVILNAGNTTYKLCREAGLPDTALSMPGGGVSGPPIFQRTLDMVRLLSPFKLPIIATGGIHTPSRAIAALNAGAALIGMATALVQNPFDIIPMNAAIEKHRKSCYTQRKKER